MGETSATVEMKASYLVVLKVGMTVDWKAWCSAVQRADKQAVCLDFCWAVTKAAHMVEQTVVETAGN